MVDITKKYKRKWITTAFISFLLNIGPLVGFTITAYITNTAVIHKVTLTMTLLVAVIFSFLAWSKQIMSRSRFWILLIGLWLCLNNILTLLIVFASCQVVDELIVTPCKNYYRGRYFDCKGMDEYMNVKGLNKQT